MLDLAGAPIALIDWVASLGDDEDEAWDGCDKGDWLVWLAACSGVSLDDVLDAACRAVRHAVRQLEGGHGRQLEDALMRIAKHADQDELSAVVRDCEAQSENVETSYRSAPPPGAAHAAHAVAHLARAVEALDAALAADQAIRSNEALVAAGTLGVPPTLMMRPQGTPLLIPQAIERDPIQQELAFAVAASAEALERAARALAKDQDDAALEDAEGELSDVMHQVLTPIRAEIRSFL